MAFGLTVAAGRTSHPGFLLLIGWYEVFGGLIGCVTFVLLGLQHRAALPGERFWVATLPFALLVTGGWALLHHRQSSLFLSLGLQGAQIVAWSLGGSVWKFSAGLYCSIGVVDEKLSFFAGWDTSFLVGYTPGGQPSALVVNVVPLVVALVLLRIWLNQRRQGRIEEPEPVR